MSRRDLLRLYRRELAAGALMLLPSAILMPLGALWLWQQGHGLWFFALCLLAAIPAGVLMLLARRRRAAAAAAAASPDELAAPEPDWPAQERAAFELVRRFAEDCQPLPAWDRERMLALARETVERVARHYRPGAADPLAEVTVPEALMMVQRVAARLRGAALEMVPGSDRVTVAQLRAAYDSRETAATIYGLARRAYAAYRITRPVLNPLGAILGEARDLIFDRAFDSAAGWTRRRLTRLFVLEVGRAAVELYSGRLRRDAAELDRLAGLAARAGVDAEPAPPLRVLIAGQTNAGKSSLLNALARDILAPVSPLPGPPGFRCFAARDPDGREFVFVDAPGLAPDAAAIAALAEEAQRADIVLWTVAAHQPARDADARGLQEFEAWFAGHPELNRPPLLCVVTHIDQLRPFAEWQPPYDIVAAERPKARAIRDAVQAIAAELELATDSIVPVSLRPDAEPYNLDALRARIAAALPEARHAQLARAHSAAGDGGWRKDIDRLWLGGRALFDALR